MKHQQSIFLFFTILLSACAPQGSYQGSPWGGYPTQQRDCRYGNCGNTYDRNYDRNYDRDYDKGYDKGYDRGYEEGYDKGNDRPRTYPKPRSNPPPPPPPPPPRPSEQVIRPNCPSGTRFDGRSCVITDSKLKKKGGDGRINACPKGMWLEGDRCVPDR